MSETTITPQKLASFGRSFSLLYNRSTMYDADHPYTKQAVDDFLPIVQDILNVHSPLSFIMNQEKFFIDEEPLDPRINTTKMGAHFKKAEIISISFFEGVKREEVRSFVEIFTTLNRYPNADAMKKEFELRGINAIKINHVLLKKVNAAGPWNASSCTISTTSPAGSNGASSSSKRPGRTRSTIVSKTSTASVAN